MNLSLRADVLIVEVEDDGFTSLYAELSLQELAERLKPFLK